MQEQRRSSAENRTDALPLRILVVDDHEDSAEIIAKALKSLGAEVRIALEGLHALNTALEFIPQVVILDLVMPGIDGYQVAQLIRKNRLLAATRLLALTGWSSADSQRRAREAGFDGFMRKPFSVDALRTLVARLFGVPQGGEERDATT